MSPTRPFIRVFADDLTGAAEMAGLGFRHGLTTRLGREPFAAADSPLTVFDTDTRPLPAIQASDQVVRAVQASGPIADSILYKKTDSVMRGPILAELESLMSVLGKPRALLVPENPSRGRTIRDGRYWIDGIPLDQTAFAHDPEYPAKSAEVLRLLGVSRRYPTTWTEPGQPLPESGIVIGAASTREEVQQWAARLDSATVPAGGADFFQAILESAGHRILTLPACVRERGKTLVVCGSASAYSRAKVATAAQRGIPVCAMPDRVALATENSRDGLTEWRDAAMDAIASRAFAIVTIGQPLGQDRSRTAYFTRQLAEAVALMLGQADLAEIWIEGGATAAAIVQRMGWSDFRVIGEWATGIVKLQEARQRSPQLVLKPGSYPWPTELAPCPPLDIRT
jgi:D-threonate/D-erythronate kinase